MYFCYIQNKGKHDCKKGCFLSFKWWKHSFATFGPLAKILLTYPLKIYYWPLLGKKSFRHPCSGVHSHLSKCWRGTWKRKLGNPWFRSWRIFAKDFFSNFPKLSGKVFCATFAYKFSPIKISKTFFDVTSKNGLHVFFCKPWAPFFEVKQRRAPILRGFSGMLPRFSADQNFWGCACTPCSNTTVFISVSQVTSQFIKIDLKHSHCSFSSTQKVQNDFIKFLLLLLRSTLLMYRNKHNRQRFFCFS